MKKMFKKIKYWWSHEKCYKEREYERHAAMGNCGGLVGGDKSTGNLMSSCMDCPYLTL